MTKKFVIVFFVFSCVASFLFGTARSSDAASTVAFQNTYNILAANSGVSEIISNFVMPQFNPSMGTLHSLDVTITGDSVTYSGVNSLSVGSATASVSLDVGVAGFWAGDLTRSDSPSGSVRTISGTFAAGQHTQVNDNASLLSLYIGNSTVNGFVGLSEAVGYQWGNSWLGFDGLKSFGATSFHVELAYNYTPSAPVPEPATMLFLGLGLVGVAGAKRKFNK